MFGDNNGNFNKWTFAVGRYSLTATTYNGSGATGMAGNSLTINFQVESQTPMARVSAEAAAGAGCLLVYPNPFRESFTLNNPGNQSLVLYDLSGRKVFALELVQDGQLIAPGEHLSPGFYLL